MLSIRPLDPAVRVKLVVGVEDERRLGVAAERGHPSFEQARIVDVAVIEDRDQFRLRQGDWRAIYWLDRANQEMKVVRIAPRGEVYKR